jgi:hypothetical protein
MTNSQTHTKPSTKQLRYLNSLAEATGQSFAYPKTSREASEEIKRLKGQKRTSRADRQREVRSIRRQMADGRGDGARVRDDELGGYGSNAGWR